jgi:urea transport system permease protein
MITLLKFFIRHSQLLMLVCGLFFSCNLRAQDAAPPVAGSPDSFEQVLMQLPQASLSERGDLLKKLAGFNDARLLPIVNAFAQAKLAANPDNRIAIRQDDESLVDALTLSPIAADMAADFKKISVNNNLRNQLNSMIAQLNLHHSDAAVRLTAVKRILTDGADEDTAKLLQAQLATEQDSNVISALNTALAIYGLHSADEQQRREAIKTLRGSLEPEARTALSDTLANDASKAVRTEAEYALKAIDNKIAWYHFGENVFFGLSLGSVLLLSAIGLAITFGVMGVINMAHGEMMMIGAYTTWVIQQLFPNHLAYSLLMAVPAAFVVAGLVGILIERSVIRFLYGRPLETLLATFGVSLILQQAARTIFTPLNRAVSLPEWMSGSLTLNPVLSITYNRLFILLFALAVFFALLLVLKKTSLGLKVRAVSQNRSMARAVGVRANWVDALTFGLGSGIAGVAGVALSQLTNVGPNLGQAYIIDSFMVVVFGGVGNLWGTLVGAMGLGVLNKFMEPYAGAVLAKVLVLVLLILFIQKKPKGLFPQKGRAAAD